MINCSKGSRLYSYEFARILEIKVGEDPQNFIDEIKKIHKVMQVTGAESVELESYELKDVSQIWFILQNENRGENANPVIRDYFFYVHVLFERVERV